MCVHNNVYYMYVIFTCMSYCHVYTVYNRYVHFFTYPRFGHQDPVTDIDCLSRERPVTSGSDRTVRVWKIVDESQLVFHGHK